MNNIMLDLETMGNSSNAAIIAIGAVSFNSSEITESFYEVVDLKSSVDAGLTMDADTVLWWMDREDDARSQFKIGGLSLAVVLELFVGFVGPDAVMWGNGASFDNVILANAYQALSVPQPWAYWNDRCYRTMKTLYPSVKMNRTGTYHCAVDDAKSQAEHLIRILSYAGVSV